MPPVISTRGRPPGEIAMNPTEFSLLIKRQIDDNNAAVILLLEIIHNLANEIDGLNQEDYLLNASKLLAYAHIKSLDFLE